jgi:hypothetical protein
MDPIFTLSINSSNNYFGYHTIFNIIALAYIFPFAISFKLNHKKIERNNQELAQIPMEIATDNA